jgi:outer membrane lipopolysaccharide assembly protein LptE/RlpB
LASSKSIIGLFVVLCGLVAACGYRFGGSGSLPEGIQLISVDILENRTADTGLEVIFSNELIYEFTRRRVYALQRDAADATLSGLIVSSSVETVSRRGQSTALQQRVKIVVNLQLLDTAGRIIWSAKGISGNETYNVGANRSQTEKNRSDAILQLSRRLAESIYSRMTDNF